MSSLNIPRRRVSRAEPTLPATAGIHDTPGSAMRGIRDLLRGTMLLVTPLGAGGKAKSIVGLHRECREEMDAFCAAVRARGYPEDVCRDAELAQCALLDESALRYLQGEERAHWALAPLQVERFGIHDAGERVFERIDLRLREGVAQIDLLECYSSVLGMGFLGRYAREGEVDRDALITKLNAQIAKLRAPSRPAFTMDSYTRLATDWLHRFSPWAIAGLLTLGVILLWVVGHAGLDVQLAQLLATKQQS